MSQGNGGPAFPVFATGHHGLSKLEWYSSVAMFALMTHGSPEQPDQLARHAFMLGLEMLKQSEREPLDFFGNRPMPPTEPAKP